MFIDKFQYHIIYKKQNYTFLKHIQYFIYQKIIKNMIDDNLVFKIIVLGQQGTILYIKMRNKGVGKSSILMRYIKDSFSDQYNVTVGVEFASKQV